MGNRSIITVSLFRPEVESVKSEEAVECMGCSSMQSHPVRMGMFDPMRHVKIVQCSLRVRNH